MLGAFKLKGLFFKTFDVITGSSLQISCGFSFEVSADHCICTQSELERAQVILEPTTP